MENFSVFLGLRGHFHGHTGLEPALLPLHPQLFQVKGQGQQEQLRADVGLAPGQKTAESKVVFEQTKGAFHLNRAAKTQMEPTFRQDVSCRLLPLLPEGFLENELLGPVRILGPATLGAAGTAAAILTPVPGGGQKYSFGRKFSAVDVLTASYEENPDPLLKLIYCVVRMEQDYQRGLYGTVVQTLKSNKPMFSQDVCSINNHNDRIQLFHKLEMIFTAVRDETKTVSDLLISLLAAQITERAYVEDILADEEIEAVLEVPAVEVIRVLNYLDDPRVSTQHGVKGESHTSVIFVADDSKNNPVVHMYRFFDLLSQMPVSIQSFNEFFYEYTGELVELQNIIKMKIGDLKRTDYPQYESEILHKATDIFKRFSDNPYFQQLCQDKYMKYLNKPGVTKARECLTESSVLGVLSAYKLFYVGCSRARKNLTVLIDETKLQGDETMQKEMFKRLGFCVE